MAFASKRWAALLVALALAGCTRSPRDDREFRTALASKEYQLGDEHLRQGDWQSAAVSFNRAIKADPDFAESYAGLAYVLAMRDQGEKAVEYADLAVKKNRRSVTAQVYKGRVYIMVKPAGWFEAAVGALDAALGASPGNREALYYKAEAFFEHEELTPAAELFEALAAGDGQFRREAGERLDYIRARQKAQPQTPSGERIVKLDAITRADVAELLIKELDLPRLISRRTLKNVQQQVPSEKSIVDIRGLPAEADIRAAVRLRVMEIFPDGKFRPHEKVLRVHLAMTLQQVMIRVTGEHALDSAFIGTPSAFPDVKSSHFAYNAVCLATQKGMMQANALNGKFELSVPASGIDALIAVRRLQTLLSGN